MDSCDYLLDVLDDFYMEDFLKNLTVTFKRKDDLPRPCRSGPRVTKLRRHGIPWFTSGFT